MEQAVDYKRVIPMRFVAAVFIVSCNVVEIAVPAGKEATTEATSPILGE